MGAGEFYDPTPLVESGGVIVVTLNYRLGVLGFLAHPALDDEGHPAVNYGVMDQQLALLWVKANIRAFGGDPRNLTIFGESSGGLNTLTNLVSPLSAPLFNRAIIQSGVFQFITPDLADSESLRVAASQIGSDALVNLPRVCVIPAWRQSWPTVQTPSTSRLSMGGFCLKHRSRR